MFEQALNDRLTRALKAEASRLAEEIRRNGAEALRNAEIWLVHQQRLMDVLGPILEGIAARGVQAVVQSVGASDVAISWDLVNQQAVEWAREHAGKLVTRVSDTTQRMVGDQVARWSESGETLPDLVDRIAGLRDDEGAPIFNRKRAEMIASTEATTTFASANAQAWQAAGYAPAVFHPSAHVRCRCMIKPVRLPDGSKVIIWETARDELVCKQPIKTPWAEVEGCRALHRVIVSAGPYLGRKLSEVRS
jgi:hypothetical protein